MTDRLACVQLAARVRDWRAQVLVLVDDLGVVSGTLGEFDADLLLQQDLKHQPDRDHLCRLFPLWLQPIPRDLRLRYHLSDLEVLLVQQLQPHLLGLLHPHHLLVRKSPGDR